MFPSKVKNLKKIFYIHCSTLLKWVNYRQKVHQENCQKKHPKKKSKEKVTTNHQNYHPKTKEFKNSMALLEFSVRKSDFGY